MQPRIKNFRQYIVFKNIGAAFIICTFLLSITPKQVLHSLAANHKDQASQKNIDKDHVQFNEYGFNCDCNNIVATSPFTQEMYKLEISKLVHVSFYQQTTIERLSTSDHFFFKLRGPPVIA